MRRGELYLADLDEPIGHEQAFSRPVLIISADSWLETAPPVVTVVPLSRTRRESSAHVEIEPGESGLKATSYARCEDIRSISLLRLGRYFGTADAISVLQVDLILCRLLALDHRSIR